jgi:hypothetical protein
MGRLNDIADTLVMIQRKPPAAVAQLYDDAPSALVQLLASLIGASGGQRASQMGPGGGGIGSSLVLAQFMSKHARREVEQLTSGRAMELLTDAATDKDLYAALLVGRTDPVHTQRAAAQRLDAWILGTADRQTEQALEDAQGR